MKKVDCSICDNKEVALNDTVKIDGKVYCSNCFNAHFADQKELQNRLVEKAVDPTICSNCNKDFGEDELNKISTYPICDDCLTAIKNKTFPTWVKAFLIGILIIVSGSFVWNWKFYSAYMNIKKSNVFFQKGDYTNAALFMKSASEEVPEVEEVRTIATYFSGIELLSKNKSTEALNEFEKCKEKIPIEYNINNLIIQARIGSNFDNKDYKGFLEAAKENLVLDTTLAVSYASVASAYACLYVVEGKEGDKLGYIDFLNKAKQIDSTSKEMKAYYNMLEYRMYSRKIVEREEFIKQFPNGWNKN